MLEEISACMSLIKVETTLGKCEVFRSFWFLDRNGSANQVHKSFSHFVLGRLIRTLLSKKFELMIGLDLRKTFSFSDE